MYEQESPRNDFKVDTALSTSLARLFFTWIGRWSPPSSNGPRKASPFFKLLALTPFQPWRENKPAGGDSFPLNFALLADRLCDWSHARSTLALIRRKT